MVYRFVQNFSKMAQPYFISLSFFLPLSPTLPLSFSLLLSSSFSLLHSPSFPLFLSLRFSLCILNVKKEIKFVKKEKVFKCSGLHPKLLTVYGIFMSQGNFPSFHLFSFLHYFQITAFPSPFPRVDPIKLKNLFHYRKNDIFSNKIAYLVIRKLLLCVSNALAYHRKNYKKIM